VLVVVSVLVVTVDVDVVVVVVTLDVLVAVVSVSVVVSVPDGDVTGRTTTKPGGGRGAEEPQHTTDPSAAIIAQHLFLKQDTSVAGSVGLPARMLWSRAHDRRGRGTDCQSAPQQWTKESELLMPQMKANAMLSESNLTPGGGPGCTCVPSPAKHSRSPEPTGSAQHRGAISSYLSWRHQTLEKLPLGAIIGV